jgi:hypothetical protein
LNELLFVILQFGALARVVNVKKLTLFYILRFGKCLLCSRKERKYMCIDIDILGSTRVLLAHILGITLTDKASCSYGTFMTLKSIYLDWFLSSNVCRSWARPNPDVVDVVSAPPAAVVVVAADGANILLLLLLLLSPHLHEIVVGCWRRLLLLERLGRCQLCGPLSRVVAIVLWKKTAGG